MGKKSRLKAERRREQAFLLDPASDEEQDDFDVLDQVVGTAATSFREGGEVRGPAVLRSLALILAAWELEVGLDDLLSERQAPELDFLRDCGKAALTSLAFAAQEPGPYRDTALWGLRELGLTLADLGVKLLPAASAEEEAERAAHMLQVIEEAGDRVWDELRRPVTAPG